MKKKLIFLFVVIIAACSDSDMSGYTDSIIKGTSSTNLENTFLQKTSDTKESNSSLEEELLGLDDEELREKLIKTYPWPNVQRVQGVNNTSEAGSSSSSENPGSSSSEIHYSETLPVPHNPYTGEIKPFDIKSFITKEHVVYITKGKDHLYGFDGLNKECLLSKNIPNHCRLKIAGETSKDDNPVIYISVKQWETAYFAPHNFKNQKEARIIHEKKYVEEDGELKLVDVHPGENLSDVAEKTTDEDKQLVDEEQYPIDVKSYGDAGLYGIYVPKDAKAAINEKQLNAKNDDSRWKRILFIQVIPYKEITKHITLVAFNGDKGDKLDPDSDTCDDGFSDAGITKACLTKNFNEVYSQAVMKVDVTQEPANKYIENNKLQENLLDVWMNDTYATYVESEQKLYEGIKNNIRQFKKDGWDKYTPTDPRWHIVVAINKVRKIWEIGNCKNHDLLTCRPCERNQDGNLKNSNCIDFIKLAPTLEQVDEKGKTTVKYYLGKKIGEGNEKKLKTDSNGEIIKTNVEIKMTQTKENSNYYKPHYHIFEEGKDHPHPIEYDDVLFVENGIPIIPQIKVLKGELGAYHEDFNSIMGKKVVDNHDDYLPYGGVAFIAGRYKGKRTAYYTLLHELGHTFGLTDASSTDVIHRQKDIDKLNDKVYHYFNEEGQESLTKYYFYNDYASSETNLMTWDLPAGAKLRYRPTQIVCTAGGKYYKKLDSFGNFSDNGGRFRTLEAKVPNGFEPNQWECIRGACHDTKYNETYSNQARKSAWGNPSIPYLIKEPTDQQKYDPALTNLCFDNQRPINPQTDKNHFVSKEEFNQKLEEFNKSKYLE